MADSAPSADLHQPEPESRPDPSSTSLPPFPNPTPSAPLAPPMQPSFRPAGALFSLPTGAATPQFSHQAPPPGVVPVGSAQVAMAPPYVMAAQPMRYGPPMSNGYPGMPQPLHQGAMPPVSRD